MLRKRLVLLLIAMALFGVIGPVWAGGWSVATLDALPAGVVAGEPFTVGFTVRQHGVRLVYDLTPSVTASLSPTGKRIVFGALEDEPGHYTVELTLPTAGTWHWSIDAFGPGQPMPPLEVVSADQAAAAAEAAGVAETLSPAELAELGAALYVAKGCFVCHQHNGVAVDAYASINSGPNLTLYRGEPDFLRAWLADPAALKQDTPMPALGLDEGEIAALIAFLNQPDQTPDASAVLAPCGEHAVGLNPIRGWLGWLSSEGAACRQG